MAQPQHVRNDDHCDIFPCRLIPGRFNPSRYEEYSDKQRERNALRFDGYSVNDRIDSNFLTTARSFWHTESKNPREGKGIAEFANVNFLSAGTNFDTIRYPYPRFEDATPWDDNANQLLESVGVEVPTECLPPNRPCLMTFFRAPVTDNYRSTESGVNDRASTLSIFDQDLKAFNGSYSFTDPDTGQVFTTRDVFSLNRFNFDEAHRFLIPRAVAYSAGLIDYFFRGHLEAEEVEFTETGIRLRVRNAIDVEKTPAWKDEILYARTTAGTPGTFVVAYEYKDSSGATRYGASPAVTAKTAAEGGGDLAPGEISSGTYDFAVSVPADAQEVKYRLVFRGKLGEEDDAIAIGVVEPFSGFRVALNYTPADGIPGPRMIFRSRGTWRLSDETGVRAGNVDWKGWYVNGRPTKVLSWMGGRRYFSTEFFRFEREIYQNGALWSIAPQPVFGVAIAKDSDGIEWLVAITSNGTTDFVYRRRNTANTSSALFDPVSAPEGWQLLGSFTPFPGGPPPDRSWFFNGTGTEAQTIRRRPSPNGVQHLRRVKITVVGSSVQIDDLGNSPGLGTTVTETRDRITPCQSGVTTATDIFTRRAVMGGEYIVGVDYLDSTEVLVKVKGSGEEVITDTITTPCPNGRQTHSFTTSINMARTLEFNDIVIPIDSREGTKNGSFTTFFGDVFQLEGSSSVQIVFDSFAVGALDARNSLIAGERRTGQFEIGTAFDRTQICDTVFLSEQVNRDVTRYRTEIVADEQTIPPRTSRCSDRSFTVEPAPLSFGPFNRSDPSPPSITLLDRGGTWAVDSSGNLAMSLTTVRNNRFNFLTNGDIRALIPPAPDSAIYSFGVIK